MADIAAANVSYDVENEDVSNEQRKRTITKIDFGDGALTYPAGGVPLESGKLGHPSNILYGSLVDQNPANGFLYKYDRANNKIRIYQGDNDNAADAPLIELAGGVATPAATTIRLLSEGH